MSLSAREQALLDATADELCKNAPLLYDYLAQGPQVLRERGVAAGWVPELVPEPERQGWRQRVRRWFLAGPPPAP